jgi:hypothetical protein
VQRDGSANESECEHEWFEDGVSILDRSPSNDMSSATPMTATAVPKPAIAPTDGPIAWKCWCTMPVTPAPTLQQNDHSARLELQSPSRSTTQ